MADRFSIISKTIRLSVGFVVGLGYENPYLSPFEEFQRFKTHPSIRPLFDGGRRISYGARAISAGGLQSVPKLTFPGGALIGDGAGFLNVPKIKGSHTAMKSGMVAAEGVVALLREKTEAAREATAYPAALKKSWLWDELSRARNVKPAFKWGLWPAMAYSALGDLRPSRQGALDAASQARPSGAEAGGGVEADFLSKARWNRQLRQALLGVRLQHQP